MSKKLMDDFHYNYMKLKYGNNANLLITDTDSLMYEMKTDIKDIKTKFDTSNYPEDYKGITLRLNKNVIGMMEHDWPPVFLSRLFTYTYM